MAGMVSIVVQNLPEPTAPPKLREELETIVANRIKEPCKAHKDHETKRRNRNKEHKERQESTGENGFQRMKRKRAPGIWFKTLVMHAMKPPK